MRRNGRPIMSARSDCVQPRDSNASERNSPGGNTSAGVLLSLMGISNFGDSDTFVILVLDYFKSYSVLVVEPHLILAVVELLRLPTTDQVQITFVSCVPHNP